MKVNAQFRFCLTAVLISLLYWSIAGLTAGADPLTSLPPQVRQWLEEATRYRIGSPQASWTALERWVLNPSTAPSMRQLVARELVRLIEQAPAIEAKQRAARLFWLIGDPQTALLLVPLLDQEPTCEAAAFALRSIDSAQLDQLLIEHLSKAESHRVRKTLIALIGDRSIAEAVPSLAQLLDQSPQLSQSIIFALGKIGTEQALEVLHRHWKEAADLKQLYETGLLESLQRINRAGQLSPTAQSVARELFHQSPNSLTQTAALELLACNTTSTEIQALLIDALCHSNRTVRCAAARRLTSFKLAQHEQVRLTHVLLHEAPPDTLDAFFDQALADQKTGFLQLAREAISTPDRRLSPAVIQYLCTVGSTEDVALLLELMCSTKNASSETILDALSRTEIPGTDRLIVQALTRYKNPRPEPLYQLVRQRRIIEAESTLLRELQDPSSLPPDSEQIIETLGVIGGPQAFERIMQIALHTQQADAAAWKSLRQIMQRCASMPALQRSILAAYVQADIESTKGRLLELLPVAPSDLFLGLLVGALNSESESTRLAALRALSQWQNLDAAAPLLVVCSSGKSETEQAIAWSGLVRMISTPGLGSKRESLRIWNNLLELADKRERRLQLLAAFMSRPLPELIEPLIRFLDDSAIAQETRAAFEKVLPILAHGQPDASEYQPDTLKSLTAAQLREKALNLAQRLIASSND